MKKFFKLGLAALAVLLITGLCAPLIDAGGYRGIIQSTLERSLNRKVKVGKVRFNVFTGPGFTVDNVEIGDDPSMGIEPLAYVDSLEARVKLESLWTRRLSFSTLRLKEPTLNLVKNDSGVWNFQLLHGVAGEFPAIQVRNGRIYFKFGDTKSVFYLSDSDLDVDPLGESRLDVRFSGQPSRTDQAAQTLGVLLARGIWKRPAGKEPELDIHAELEPSAISELARIIEGRGIGLHGVVASKAHIVGPISKLGVTGQLKLDDVHRWDLMPKGGGGWQLNYRGTLSIPAQRLELETAEKDNPGTPLVVRLRASDLLSTPRWAASVDLRGVPAPAFVEAARHMGAAVPDNVTVEGTLRGAVGYSRPGGFQGQLSAQDAAVRLPKTPLVRFHSADVLLEGTRVNVGPSTAEMDNGQTAELSASYELTERTLDFTLKTSGMSVGELQKGAGVSVPVLGAFEHGSWKGWLRYQSGEGDGWSGDFDVRDARLQPPGFAVPVRIASAVVAVDGPRIAITRIMGSAGAIKLAGEFRRDAGKPDRIKLDIADADLTDVERVLLPTLRRTQGLFARFRLRAAPVPEWLRERHVEAVLRATRLTTGEQVWKLDGARLDWNGATARILGIEASNGDAELAGELVADLSGGNPRYHFSGSVNSIEYKGGHLSIAGAMDASGTGPGILTSLKSEGTFEGENIAFSPDVDFQTVSGSYDWVPGRLRIRNLQAGQGFEDYLGQGSTQPDGRLLLELTSGKRQLKVAATPFGNNLLDKAR
jgi:hypothetical protein